MKEGAAIEDLTRPDRIALGVGSNPLGHQTMATMRQLYAPINHNNEHNRVMDVQSAEFTKYVTSAMLATGISFMDERANLDDQLGAEIELVRQGIVAECDLVIKFFEILPVEGAFQDVMAINSQAIMIAKSTVSATFSVEWHSYPKRCAEWSLL